MENMYDLETALAELKEIFSEKPGGLQCPKEDLAVCLGLLKEKSDFKRQIRQIEKQIAEKQKEITESNMYLLHGMEYTALLSATYHWDNWERENETDDS